MSPAHARPAEASAVGDAPPAWLEALAVGVGLVVAAFAVPGLLLAVAGAWSAPLALGLGVVASAGAIPVVRAITADAAPASRAAHLAAAGAVALAALTFVANGRTPAQHVFIDRDPGAYTTAGRWLAREGDLEPHVAVGPFADADAAGLRFGSIAVPDADDGHVQLQFSHALPVLLADAHAIGGYRLFFRVPALLGAAALLAVFAALHRVLGRPGLALAATATVAVALPQVAISRDTFSEPLAQLWLWSGVVALLAAHRRRSWPLGLAAGVLLGAVTTARIDGFSYLLVLPVLAVLAIRPLAASDRRDLVRTAVTVGAGAAATAVVAGLDLGLRGGDYGKDNADALKLAAAGFVASSVVAVVSWFAWDRLKPVAARLQRPAATTAAALAAVGLTVAWLLRPHLQTAKASVESGLIAQLQEAEGKAVDPLRSYAEQTMTWFSWYLGPITLALAIAGAALAAHRLLSKPGPSTAPLLVAVAVAAPSTALYLWEPGAAPDHIWVMRRFAPAGIVLVVALAAHALARMPQRAAAGVVAVAGVAWAGAVTWPVREHREQGDYLTVVDGTCETIGDDAAVVFIDDDTPLGEVIAGGLPMSIRAWCGVPVAIAPASIDPTELDGLAAAWSDEGRTLWLAGAIPDTFGSLADAGTVVDSPLVVNDHALDRTVSHRPDGYRTEQLGFSLLPWRP